MTVNWETPDNNNGCPITGYKVQIDDGAEGVFTIVNPSDQTNPGLH